MPHAHLDAKGLLCPLPVLRARKALRALSVGGILVVEATDAAAPADFAAFCAATGERLLSSAEENGVYRFEIEKTATQPRGET
ncbi:MAG: sulfurtransferase TusA family protein [Rhodospirillaceae bacterium]